MTCWGEIKYKNMYFFKKKLKIFKNFFYDRKYEEFCDYL